ncbi:unnamed protein product, partial [Laminaria digitata]
TRSLTKALGIPSAITRESRIGVGGGGGGTSGASGGGVIAWGSRTTDPARGKREAGGRSSIGRSGSGGGGGSDRATVDSKDEACQAFEQWLVRPTDLAKKRARLARAGRQTVDLVASGGGAWADRTGRGSSGG